MNQMTSRLWNQLANNFLKIRQYLLSIRLAALATIVTGGYATGLTFASGVNLAPNSQTKVAVAFALVAGFLYLLDPKKPEEQEKPS